MATRSSRARNWLITWNNAPRSDALSDGEQFELAWSDLEFNYMVGQLEVGEEGTPHWQVYVEFDNPRRFGPLKKQFPNVHLETRRGTRDQARGYCMKEDTRVAGPWESGVWRQQRGRRVDLEAVMERVKAGATMRELYEEFPAAAVKYSRGLQQARIIFEAPGDNEAPQVSLVIGQPGCGKTRLALEELGEDIWVNPLGAGGWFDGYDGNTNVLFDDFAGRMSGHRLTDTLRLLDRYSLRVQTKGGHVAWRPKKVYMTTNYHPRCWWDWDRRELQYPALARRFTEVIVWTDPDGEPARLSRPHDGWKRIELDVQGKPKTKWDAFWWEESSRDEYHMFYMDVGPSMGRDEPRGRGEY